MQPQCDKDIKKLLEVLNISHSELSLAMGKNRTSVGLLLNAPDRVPKGETVAEMVNGINSLLEKRGSEIRVTYDQLWSAFCLSRFGVLPVKPPDTSADLTAIDQESA